MLAVLFSLHAGAQNAVDRMVEDFATVGEARFTSAIERNPQTREVVKVVKTLRLGEVNHHKLSNGFLQEAKNHDSNTTVANGRNTVIFSEGTRQSARVYMLKYNDDYAEVTIIVNFKKSQK
jgi:predicted nucleotidyltransferase